jgi:nucleotide-binding universal stress UspA family protein
MSETRTFWLSFCDATKPKGQQFLGVAVIDVTEAMAADALIDMSLRFPQAQDGAEWVGAALREAHRLGCNPGGEVGTVDVTDAPPARLAVYPRGVLLSKARMRELETAAEAAGV